MAGWHGGGDWISLEEPHKDVYWSTKKPKGGMIQVNVQEKIGNTMYGGTEVQG